MALAAGTRFGPYRVAESIGSGGMGEVYRATDTNLKREVAIKILPKAFVDDADRVARFQREAEALAAVNHPNIAQIHGLERSEGSTALVMELVEGPTLADRIAQGPIPYDEALGIAIQVADALEAAHGRGIVHRDLKPANIKVRPDGTVKVLDFGIATAPESPLVTSGKRSPALLTPALTEAGILLGTAAYMSPEQARGKAVDERADIWAFGCLLYEMLTGQPAFGGEDVTTTLARVLERDTDMTSMPGTTSPAVRHTIKLCLKKDPRKRIADIRDVRLALEGTFESELPRSGRSADTRPVWHRALPHAATLIIGAGLVALGGWIIWPEPPAAPTLTRFLVVPPATAPLASLSGYDIAISPDGTQLAYLAESDRPNEVAIYLRDLDALEARFLVTTSSAGGSVNPFFSADGAWIGFWSEGVGIMRVPVDGGPQIKIVDDLRPFRGATVARDGTLIYATLDGLYRVSTGGSGKPQALTPESREDALTILSVRVAPVLLPGERAVLVTRASPDGGAFAFDVAVLDLATGEQTALIEDGMFATYAATGHLVFVRGTTLMAVPFDAGRLAVTGEEVALFEGVRAPAGVVADYALSASGTLAYVPGSGEAPGISRVVWVGRNGQIEERPPVEPVERPRNPQLSPDGQRLILTSGSPVSGDLWIHELDGRPASLLADDGDNRLGVWSPDGTRVAFASNELYVLPSDGSVLDPVPLRSAGLSAAPYAWSAGGELIVVRASATNAADLGDIAAVRPDADSEPRDVVATSALESQPALAPNGRWLAYVSNRTGQFEIWVKGYPDGVPRRVSSAGGRQPVWSRDGRELFYLQGNAMMAVAVETEGDFSFATPAELFVSPYVIEEDVIAALGQRSYDVGPDGRFLMFEPTGDAADAPEPSNIVVVENWTEELKQRMPTE